MRLLLILLLPAALFAGTERLEAEMARLARVARGVVGATAIHIETGRIARLNPEEHFPMASTVKVPIATHLLALVDEGKLSLDRMVTVEPSDLHPGSGTLSDLFNKPGVSLSVRNLLELMLLISDNSATDMLLREVGGADAVNARLHAIGIEGLRVDRPTVLLIADGAGAKLPPQEQWSLEMFRQALRAVTPADRAAARARFREDPRDTSTPDAMARLLVRIYRKELHKPETAELFLDILRRCRTGEARLKGLLPEDTMVAHKTGSLTQVADDVGIITLPGDAGHVALAVFVKNSEANEAQRDRAIAEIARAAHDFFLFEPRGDMDYLGMVEHISRALDPRPGEKIYFGGDPHYFEPLRELLRQRFQSQFTPRLEEASVYLWLPYKPGSAGMGAAEREALVNWTSKGGSRRQLHFHWGEGSVYADGLYGEHSADLDAVYRAALDIDYTALSKAQDRAIEQFRSGIIRVTTPAGTDLRFRTGDRPFNKQDGDASAARAEHARMRIDRDIELPSGVLRVAPIEETATGVIVIPEGRFGNEIARNVRFTMDHGQVTRVQAGENLQAVNRLLEQGGEAARRFREFALGFNPQLKPAPGAKVLPYYGYGEGVVRLSLGDNQELGGKVTGGFVRWFFFPDAKVTVNGREFRP